MGIDSGKVDYLLARTKREVDEGLLPSCQVALAYNGELVANEAYGDATVDTRYQVFSATKAFVAGAVWALMGDGEIDVTKRVVDYIPEFGTNGKDVITVEQVMLHTSGFPHAPLGPPQWDTRAGRIAAFERWKLNWEPGTSYEYHATSAHWVLAEIIDRVTGGDYRDVVEDRVTGPAGLPRVLGLEPGKAQDGIAELSSVGEPATPAEIQAAFGVTEMPVTEVTPEALLAFNRPDVRAVGVPGGGAAMRASDLALYYQAVLHNPGEMWAPAVLADVTTVVRNKTPRALVEGPGQPQPRADPGRRRRQRQRAGPRAHRVARRLRPQRGRRAAGVGRSGHRTVARLLHERHRPEHRA